MPSLHACMEMRLYPDKIVHRTRDVPDIVAEGSNNWIIADAVLPRDERIPCRVIIVTSPKLPRLSRHIKQGFQSPLDH